MLLGLEFFLTLIVMLLHLGFAIAEMFFWNRIGPGLLRTRKPEAVALTKALAFNQGFYNLLVVAGLGWALIAGSESIALAFLVFVILAGIVGWITVTFRIFLVQAVPSILAMIAILAC